MTAVRRPVCRCIACGVTFLRAEDYQRPETHRCIVLRHPSAQPLTPKPAS